MGGPNGGKLELLLCDQEHQPIKLDLQQFTIAHVRRWNGYDGIADEMRKCFEDAKPGSQTRYKILELLFKMIDKSDKDEINPDMLRRMTDAEMKAAINKMFAPFVRNGMVGDLYQQIKNLNDDEQKARGQLLEAAISQSLSSTRTGGGDGTCAGAERSGDEEDGSPDSGERNLPLPARTGGEADGSALAVRTNADAGAVPQEPDVHSPD